MSEEFLDILNENFEIRGRETRETVHKMGLLHRTFHCWIVDENYLYFQIRNNHVSFPDLLDVTVGGHVRSGETVQDASREIEEEIGMIPEFEDLHFLGNHIFTFTDNEYNIRELADVYIIQVENGFNSLKPDGSELAGVAALAFNSGKELLPVSGGSLTAKVKLVSGNGYRIGSMHVSDASFVPNSGNYFLEMFQVSHQFVSGNSDVKFNRVIRN